MSPLDPPDQTAPAQNALSGLLEDLARAPDGNPEAWPVPGERLAERYEVVRELGRGGFGVVLEAHDTVLHRQVALKLFRPGRRGGALDRTLLGEADAIATLSHPNILQIFDRGACPAGPFLVLELLEGEPLSRRIGRGPLDPAQATRIALGIARALAHAHVRGIVHRDLKPSNVFVCFDGQVKVLDFGLAHLVGRERHVDGGTPGWMAPEQRRGEPGDERSDVWALGALLLRTLAGPSPADPQLTVAGAPDLEALAEAMLSTDPAARPRNCTRVVEALEPIAQRLAAPPAADAPSRGQRPPARQGARVLLFAGLALAVALGVAAGSWLLSRDRADLWPSAPPANPLSDARFTPLTDFEGVEESGAISRDGRFVAFLSDRGGRVDVWVTQVGTGLFGNLTLGSAAELPNPLLRALGFSPDGALVTYWQRREVASRGPDISVWAAPLLGGQPRPYLEGIAEYDWSSGGRLVYHTSGPGDPMFVSDSGRLPDARPIFTAPAGLHGHYLLWSPDQAFVYFVQGSLPDRLDLWRIRATGGTPERITHHDSRVTYPVFLDARTLLYLATTPDGLGPFIHSLDVERGTSRRVSGDLDSYTSLAASADGRRIVATLTSPKATLWRLPIVAGRAGLSAAHRIPLTTGNGFFPRMGPDYLLYVSSKGTSDSLWMLRGSAATEIWSAPDTRIIGAPAIRGDGRRVAFQARHGGRSVLHAVNADGTDARSVTSALDLRGSPAWAPDGRSITVSATVDGRPGLFAVPAEGGAPEPLVRDYALDPAWSPDGVLVAYSGADVGTTFPVRTARQDGSPYPLPALTLTRGARRLAFLPTGRTLVVMRGDISHKDLWLVDLETGAERQLTDFGPGFEVRDYDVSRDGRELVVEQVKANSDIVLIERPAP